MSEAVAAYLQLAENQALTEFVLNWIISNAVASTFDNVLALSVAGASRFLLVRARQAPARVEGQSATDAGIQLP